MPSFEATDAPESNEERERRERIIQSLDRRLPHGLGEDLRYKRPAVFTLDGVPFDGTNIWFRVYETLCGHLTTLKLAVYCGRAIYAETDLSANQIRDNIARLVEAFGFPRKAFAVYLREDRDAG